DRLDRRRRSTRPDVAARRVSRPATPEQRGRLRGAQSIALVARHRPRREPGRRHRPPPEALRGREPRRSNAQRRDTNDEQRVLLEGHAVDPWPALTRGRSSSRRGGGPADERRPGGLWGRIERPGSHGRQWSSSVGSGDRLDGYWDWLLVLRQLGAEHPGDRTRRRRLRGRARWFDGPADPQHGQLERRLVRERVVRVDLHRQREGTY